MARFSKPGARKTLESSGVTCIRHDPFESFDDLPDDFDHVFHSALPLTRNAMGRTDVPSRDRWPNSFDAYADATGRLMAHGRSAKVLGECEITWREGCRMLVAQCWPELAK